MHDAEDLRNRPFLDRKAALARLLRGTQAVSRSTNTLPRTVPPYSNTPAGLALRAIVSKRVDGTYWSGPYSVWIMVCNQRASRCSGSAARTGTGDLGARSGSRLNLSRKSHSRRTIR